MDDPNVVSPGILGFLAFFFLAVALYLLVRNMNGHLRRMRYRAEQLERQEQQEAQPQQEPQEPQEPRPERGQQEAKRDQETDEGDADQQP